jgi:hypothetical protein
MCVKLAAMQLLHQAIAVALQEAARGIAAARPLPPELGQVTADRLRITLNFALDKTGTQASAGAGPHSLSLDFKLGPVSEGEISPVPAAPPVVAAPAVDATSDIFGTLQQVFGAPGFDSSARAMVFREALEGLTQEQARVAVARLRPGVPSPADPATQRAGNILRGICHSGPLKNAARGGQLLAALLAHHPLLALLAVAETEWKTHDDWLG